MGLFLARVFAVINLQTPMHIVTSGFEEESLFALWKYVNGEAVYQDPHQLPYAASYFNWLFYGVYGQILKWFAPDSWLPTLARAITLGFVLLGFGVCFTWFKRLQDSVSAFCLSTVVMMSPLIGFWGLTARPDLPAFCLEICACAWYFLSKDKKPIASILVFSLLAYAAWSFKQINVIAPGALGLYLLLNQQLKKLWLLTLSYFALVVATLWLSPNQMFEALTFSDTHLGFSLSVWFENLSKAIIKTLPLWLMVAFGVMRIKKWWQQDLTQFALCGLVVWSIILLPASSKIGSADNYHFIACFFLALLVLDSWTHKPKALTFSWGLYGVVLVASLVLGQMKISMKEMHHYHLAVAQCLNNQISPTFIHNHYLSLPWMSKGPHYFVTAYNYHFDRAHGYPYQHDGIGGLINSGYFNTIALPKQTQHFDGADLEHYTASHMCGDFQVYLKS